AHPIVNRILQWRELTKLRSTYVESLPNEVHVSTGRIHTDYNQTVAATGRLSSESPNLQNIPVRTEQGRQIRAAFVAKPWEELSPDAEVNFVSADYSQIELRVLAHLSEDDGLIAAFRNGEDIHAATASGAYGVSIDDVQPEMRRVAKMMNFGVIYGLSAHGLSQRSGMERRDAQAFIDAYFGRFERVAQWIEETKETTHERGFAETLMGRRRYLPEINSRNFQRRNAAERMAVNMPVQGTAADVMKRAMIDIDEALRKQELRSRMLLQVHDELIFEVPDEEVDQLASLLHEIMPASLNLVVPLQIEVKSAPNWRDLEPLEVN
ncbi:MAG: DNA polymerase, partial [Chloroflexi bacterium]|nr:DNA polymerase [Chloroflexota bacterium]